MKKREIRKNAIEKYVQIFNALTMVIKRNQGVLNSKQRMLFAKKNRPAHNNLVWDMLTIGILKYDRHGKLYFSRTAAQFPKEAKKLLAFNAIRAKSYYLRSNTKNKPLGPTKKQLPVKVYLNGKKIGTYESVYAAQHQLNLAGVSADTIIRLKKLQVVKKEQYDICLKAVKYKSTLRKQAEFRAEKIAQAKKVAAIKSILQTKRKIAKAILILDSEMQVKKIWTKSMVQLAEHIKIPVGTIKSALSKYCRDKKKIESAEMRRSNSDRHYGQYFAYIEDFIA